MKELLLLGGSHQSCLVSYLKDIGAFNNTIKEGYRLKAVGCPDLDLANYVKIDSNSNIHCGSFDLLAETCVQAYGEPIIKYDPERIICLSIGSWHRATTDPIWRKYYPVEVEPDLDQIYPISTLEVINRVILNVNVRLNTILHLLITQKLNILVIIPPPIPLCHQAIVSSTPARTVRYIDLLCYKIYVTLLDKYNIKHLDITDQALGNDSFLDFNYWLSFKDNHANNKYAAYLWKSILKYFDERNWDPKAFQRLS
ncbi:MAG: hypothetical protein LBI10_11675 [Deltaproteobacteria bacterium]|jgi:hypothetical protein|nr:hypothetical protein [Deltaproteobacteria bacterium]